MMVASSRMPPPRAVAKILASVPELATNPELAKSFRDQIVSARLVEVRRIIDQGVERGDLRKDIDYELAHEFLFGPVYYRLLLSGSALDRKLASRIVDTFLRAFGP